MPKALDPKLKDLAKALYFQGFNLGQVAEKTGVKHGSLRTWCKRETWTQTKNQVVQVYETSAKPALAVQVANDLNAKSKAAKEALADVITAQAEALKAEPGRSMSQLRNTPQGQGAAAVAKTLAETAAKVFGWSESGSRTIVNVALMGQMTDDTIDV